MTHFLIGFMSGGLVTLTIVFLWAWFDHPVVDLSEAEVWPPPPGSVVTNSGKVFSATAIGSGDKFYDPIGKLYGSSGTIITDDPGYCEGGDKIWWSNFKKPPGVGGDGEG